MQSTSTVSAGVEIAERKGEARKMHPTESASLASKSELKGSFNIGQVAKELNSSSASLGWTCVAWKGGIPSSRAINSRSKHRKRREFQKPKRKGKGKARRMPPTEYATLDSKSELKRVIQHRSGREGAKFIFSLRELGMCGVD